jgi:hypothetical protein
MSMVTPVPQMLTANRLKDGDVLYWKAGAWVAALKDGEVFAESAPAEAALAAAQSFVIGNVVVNPYLFDVRVDANDIHPVKEREIIRAAGPSVRSDLGKQAFHPPLEGGSKNPKGFSGRGAAQTSIKNPSPKSAAQISTLPQGEGGEDTMDSFDVSI